MTFERLIAADVVAMVAALALLFAMGVDWYSTNAGDEARRIERLTKPRGALGGEVSREVEKRAQAAAEGAEKNAYQVAGTIDRVILGWLLATVLIALAAGFLRAAEKRFEPPFTPSSLAAMCAGVAALLVAYRSVEQPGFDAATTIKPGLPLALALLGVVALAGRAAARAEETGNAWREPAPRDGEPSSSGQPRGPGQPPANASIESTR